MRPFGNETGRAIVSPPRSNRWRVFNVEEQGNYVCFGRWTRAYIRERSVARGARVRASPCGMDGRSARFAQTMLPPIEVVPVPDVLNTLPRLHEDRPRGSKAMLDAAGARARLCDVRAGAWLISPYTGWKWAKWPSGDVGWLPANVELPPSLQVAARNDIQ